MKKPCKMTPEYCSAHKYHCGKCNRPLTYSPANYASRPTDIPNPCENCFKEFSQTLTPLKAGETKERYTHLQKVIIMLY